MANIIQIKNSGTSSAEPSAASLSYGELAINYRDGKLFFKDHNGDVSFFSTGAPAASGVSDTEIMMWMNMNL